jgi:hypothetical protein
VTTDPSAELLPGLLTVLLALFGGAAGSALLELWWKPRRTRRRVAALLAEEVNLNAQMCVLHTHLRQRAPGHISPDFQLSHLAFDAVAQEIGELPPEAAGQVILTYHRFDHLRRLREMFSERYRRWRDAESTGQGNLEKLKHSTVNALDAFNVNLDTTLKEAQAALALLRPIAPKRKWREVSAEEYAERVARLEAERIERTKGLEERLEPPLADDEGT